MFIKRQATKNFSNSSYLSVQASIGTESFWRLLIYENLVFKLKQRLSNRRSPFFFYLSMNRSLYLDDFDVSYFIKDIIIINQFLRYIHQYFLKTNHLCLDNFQSSFVIWNQFEKKANLGQTIWLFLKLVKDRKERKNVFMLRCLV